jgi:peptidyl-prolyl cis-trans isomerase A (cyclophilin A)
MSFGRTVIAGLVLALGAPGLPCAMAQDAAARPAGAGVADQAAPAAAVPALVSIVIHTALGDIRLALEADRAPLTVRNFLRYVDLKRFDGCDFYRAVKIDEEGKYGLVQGGLHGNPKRAFKPVAHEAPAVTGLSHVSGAISMARTAPGTATADFFIVVGDLVALDGKPGDDDPGYAVFGRVTDGMEVVRQILDQPRSPEAGEPVMKGQMLANPVKILSVRRAE